MQLPATGFWYLGNFFLGVDVRVLIDKRAAVLGTKCMDHMRWWIKIDTLIKYIYNYM